MAISQEAEKLALRLLASYPAVPVSRMSMLAIAEALDHMGEVAEQVIDRARTELVKPPSVAQLYEIAREIHVEVAKREHPALTPGEFVEAMPDDVREKWHAMQARWAAEAGETA